MTTKLDIIQTIINNKKLKKYLEIGIATGDTFNKVNCLYKVGIDPLIQNIDYNGVVFELTSNGYFEKYKETFDIIFIDGLHLYEQAICDIVNSFKFLNKNGFLVIHDCLPQSPEMCKRETIRGLWTGDVYKAFLWFRDFHSYLPSFVINEDFGCGVIHKLEDLNLLISTPETALPYNDLNFSWLQNNLNKLNIKEFSYLNEYLNKE